MGERCWLSVKCRRKDLKIVQKVLDDDTENISDLANGWIELEIEEANWALEQERLGLAELGIVFFGFHGSVQGAYPAAIFASNGDGTLYQVMCLDCDGMTPVVDIGYSGEINQHELEAAKECLKVYNELADEAFGYKVKK